MDVGIIKQYDSKTGFGFVYEENSLCPIIDDKSLRVSIGEVVVFSKLSLIKTEAFVDIVVSRNGFCCGKIWKVEEKVTELKDLFSADFISKLNYKMDWSYSDISLLCFQNKEILDHFIAHEKKPYEEFLNNIDNYLNSIDFNNIINDYKVSLNIGEINKPGKETIAYADIESTHILEIHKFDSYLKDLFPEISIQKINRKGYGHYNKILEDYDSSRDEKEAEKINDTIKFRANTLYSLEKHRQVLEAEIKQKLSYIPHFLANKYESHAYKILAQCFTS